MSQLPGFQQLTEVGRGAYGVVYRAWQETLRRHVAVKVLTTRLDAQAARRFAQECHTLGALSGHPNIVTVHETGTTPDGDPYLVMPFYDRGSLADRVADAPLPWPEVLDVGVRLAGALQTAHDAGILHRDVKPANVLVDSYHTAQLADFGQARHSDADLTGTGTAVVGTPAYAAPELLRGGVAGPLSDVHSLAATLVALLTGHGPYSRHTGENVATVMYRVVNEPPADLRAAGVPERLCEVLEWALEKDPTRRPPSAAVFGKALQGLQHQLGRPVSPLVVAGETSVPPPARSVPPQRTPPAPPPGGFPPRRPVPSPGPARSGPPPGGGFPNARPTPSPTPPPPAKRRVAWLAAAAVVVVAAVATSVALLLSDDDPSPSTDPEELLLTASDYGLDDLRPVNGISPIFTQLVGQPGDRPQGTDLARCLDLPISGVVTWQPSAVYAQGTPLSQANGEPEPVSVAQSAGLVMDTPAQAATMVRNWTDARVDKCRVNVIQAGVSLVGDNAPVIPELEIKPLAMPDGAGAHVGKRIVVPLNSTTQPPEPVGTFYIDIDLMSRGDLVVIAVVQHFPDEPADSVHKATTAAMDTKLGAA